MKKIVLVLALMVAAYASGQVIGMDMSNYSAKSEAEMNAITISQGLQEGSVIYREDTDSLWRYNGTVWAEMTGGGSPDWSAITNKPANLDEDSTNDITKGTNTVTSNHTVAESNGAGYQIDTTADEFTAYGGVNGTDRTTLTLDSNFMTVDMESTVGVTDYVMDGSYNSDKDVARKEDVDAAITGFALLSGGPTTQTFAQNTNAFTNITASGSTTTESLDLNPRSTPLSSGDGAIYYDSDTNEILGRVLGAWVNLGQTAGGVTDGDKGDITVSSGGTAWTIDAAAVGKDEIEDNSIEEAELEATNAATDNYILTYDLATGGFTWVDPATVSGSADGLGPDGDKGDITVGGTGTTLSIDDDAINSSKILNQSITSNDIAIGGVTSANLLDDSILPLKLNNSQTLGASLDGYVWTYTNATNEFTLVDPTTLGGGTDDQTLSLAGTGNKDLTIETGNTVDLTAVDGIDPDNIVGTISGRTGSAITAMMEQTAAQLATDGDPSAGQFVLCSNCAPLTDAGGATIDFSKGNQREDDRSNDAATITFSNLTVNGELQVGAFVKIRYNRASEPAYSGATMKPLPNTFAFPANTECVGVYEVNDDGEIDYYFYEVTP